MFWEGRPINPFEAMSRWARSARISDFASRDAMKARRGRFWIPALGILSVVVMSCSSNIPVAPVRRVTLVGTIRDPDGVPIPGVGVGIVGSYAFKFTNTDSTGSYEAQVPEGIYDI